LAFLDNLNDEISKQFEIKTNNPTSSSVSIKIIKKIQEKLTTGQNKLKKLQKIGET